MDPSFRNEIAEEYGKGVSVSPEVEKKVCRFLRETPGGSGTSCAIYPTRPKVCREFRCYRMIIHNHEGFVCGRVIGKNTLRTEDPVLEMIWSELVAAIPYRIAEVWNKNVAGVLADHGYRAEPVE